MVTVFDFRMLRGRAHSESASHEGIDKTGREAADKYLEPGHVAATDTLRGPGTVVVQTFGTIVAERAVLCVYVFPGNDLTFSTEFSHVNRFDFVKIAFRMDVGVPWSKSLVLTDDKQESEIME